MASTSLPSPPPPPQGGRLKQSQLLVEGNDFFLLPEMVWRVFILWYGSVGYSWGPALPRLVSDLIKNSFSLRYSTQQSCGKTQSVVPDSVSVPDSPLGTRASSNSTRVVGYCLAASPAGARRRQGGAVPRVLQDLPTHHTPPARQTHLLPMAIIRHLQYPWPCRNGGRGCTPGHAPHLWRVRLQSDPAPSPSEGVLLSGGL